ncbi:MAG: hypothetical protein ABI389_02755 [Rhodanobacter sp.]
MQIRCSTVRLLAGIAMFAVTAACWAQPSGEEHLGTAQIPAQHEHAERLPAVALSYDGRYLAWIMPHQDNTELVLASGSASHPRSVALPAHCGAEGIRWAHRQNELAVLARCPSGSDHTKPIQRAIWLLDAAAGTPPRKLANIDGLAEGLQWTSDGKRIAFLYRPDVLPAARAGSINAAPVRRSGGRSVIVAVMLPGGPLQVLTPSALYVHEFRLSRIGRAVAYTATPASVSDHSAPRSLYTQQAIANATPVQAFDPGSAQGSARGLRITLPRWSPDSQIFFLGRLAGDHSATGGDLYRLVGSSGKVQNLTGQQRIKPTWFTFHRGHLLVTQMVAGETQVASYHLMGSWARQTALLFTVPGVIGDGRAASAVSLSYRFPGSRIAYFQRETAQASPVLHVGLLGTQPPPRAASTNAMPAVDSTSTAPAD